MEAGIELEAFRTTVMDYFRSHGRDLPWRRTRDPYEILVSEVMLQQTQVARVVPKYGEFLAAFPTVGDLAAAPLSEVLRVWQGLGYNRRARALKKAAELIAARHGGDVPRDLAALKALPGIGPATAAAVGAFAFGHAYPFIETNIRTVYLHHFFPQRSDVPDSEILPLVEATLDRDDPRSWYYALMDYGVMLKAAHPNPSQRSRHHTRQSPFEGSRRHLRGLVLRVLLERPGSTETEVASAITAAGAPRDERLGEVLAELTKEGLVAQEGDTYRIGP